MLRTKWIRNISQKCPWSNTPTTQLNLSINHVADRNWLLNSRLLTSDPPTPDPHRENCLQVVPGENGLVEEHTTKRETSCSIQNSATIRIAHLRIYLGLGGRFKPDDSRTFKDEVLLNSILDAQGSQWSDRSSLGGTTRRSA